MKCVYIVHPQRRGLSDNTLEDWGHDETSRKDQGEASQGGEGDGLLSTLKDAYRLFLAKEKAFLFTYEYTYFSSFRPWRYAYINL